MLGADHHIQEDLGRAIGCTDEGGTGLAMGFDVVQQFAHGYKPAVLIGEVAHGALKGGV